MTELRPQAAHRHFSPWTQSAERSCRTCAHATGYDGVHLWCTQHRLVVIDPCGWWMREPGSD
ncbi:MAG: hypothetical protein ACM3IK_12050 [Sphingomonadaceae bacterium]